MDRKFTATVVRATGSWYDVLHDGETVRCRIRGRLRLKGVRSTNPVVVGDEVACEADEGGDYVIADILPEAQNAPADVLKKAMLDAARTLCRRSKVWRVDVEGTLIPGIAQVELELPRETSVVDVAYLYTQREQLFTGRFSTVPDGTVTLADVPVDGGLLRAVVSLVPTTKATCIDDGLYGHWGTVIRHGARWLLKSMHGREWFEAQVALYHQQEFERGIGQAAHAALNACRKSPIYPLKNSFL